MRWVRFRWACRRSTSFKNTLRGIIRWRGPRCRTQTCSSSEEIVAEENLLAKRISQLVQTFHGRCSNIRRAQERNVQAFQTPNNTFHRSTRFRNLLWDKLSSLVDVRGRRPLMGAGRKHNEEKRSHRFQTTRAQRIRIAKFADSLNLRVPDEKKKRPR